MARRGERLYGQLQRKGRMVAWGNDGGNMLTQLSPGRIVRSEQARVPCEARAVLTSKPQLLAAPLDECNDRLHSPLSRI